MQRSAEARTKAGTPRPLRGYRSVARIGTALAGWWARSDQAQRAHAGRLAAPDVIEAWARQHRDRDRPLVWIHAASVGEGLQANAVLRRLAGLKHGFQAVVTRYSASAELISDRFEADLTGYAPYDRYDDVERCFKALEPVLMVFTKDDVWTEMATAAARYGAHPSLVAGTVDPGSSRLRWPARSFGRPGYAALECVGAISDADAGRLVQLGVRPAAITVTGDPRVDSALERIEAVTNPIPTDPMLLVAGSTWREDEAVLLAAFAIVRHEFHDARLLLVPHEPDAAARASIAARAASAGLPTPHAWRADSEPQSIRVVETRGQLAELYHAGAIAYVGGGFSGKGIHSVLEPAASRVPVLVGPEDRGQRDVAMLAHDGGLVQLPANGTVAALARQWGAWLRDPAAAAQAGEAARSALKPDRGAAERSAELIAALL